MTAVLDRLEAKELLQRLPHPEDRRSVLVQLHPSAFEGMEPLYRGVGEAVVEILSQYNDEGLNTIISVFGEIASRQRREIRSLQAPGVDDHSTERI